MSNELAVKNVSGGLVVRTTSDLQQLGELFAKSGFFSDTRDAAQCAVKILAGVELGFGAFQSMAGIHLIQGKPAVGANLMASAVKRNPKYDYRVKKLDATGCELEFFQGRESLGISSFTLEEAKKAGTKNLDKFARNMFFARAMSNGIRWFCPDVFSVSVYTPEELGADTDEEGNIITVDVKPAPPLPQPTPPQQANQEAQPQQTAVEMITAKQVTVIQAALNHDEVKPSLPTREAAREFVAYILGIHPPLSIKDLNKLQAQSLIDRICKDTPEGLRTNLEALFNILERWSRSKMPTQPIDQQETLEYGDLTA